MKESTSCLFIAIALAAGGVIVMVIGEKFMPWTIALFQGEVAFLITYIVLRAFGK